MSHELRRVNSFVRPGPNSESISEGSFFGSFGSFGPLNYPNDPMNDPNTMTDSAETAMYSAWETRSECPFKDRSVWDSCCSRPGTFHIEMFKKKPEQMKQIFQYFAGAKSLQEQRKRAKDSYRLCFDIFRLNHDLVCCDQWSSVAQPRKQFDLDFTAPHFRQGDLTTRFDSKKYSRYLSLSANQTQHSKCRSCRRRRKVRLILLKEFFGISFVCRGFHFVGCSI